MNAIRRLDNSINQDSKEKLSAYTYQRFVKLGTKAGTMNYLDLSTGSVVQRDHVIIAIDYKHKDITGQHNYNVASEVLKHTHLRPVVANETRYAPGKPAVVQELGLYYINTWRRPSVKPCETDSEQYNPKPFVDFINDSVGPKDAKHLMMQLALLVRHPLPNGQHPKRPVALYLFSQHQGQGKSTLARIMQQVLGKTAVNVIAGVKPLTDMNAVELFGRTLLVCEEADMSSSPKLADRLKQFITDDSTVDALKGAAMKTYRTPSHLWMLSNRPPSHIDEHDRRWLVLSWDTGLRGKAKDDYFNRFNAWLNSGGYSSILTYLMNYDTSDYDYASPAPMTTAKTEILSSFGVGFGSDWQDYVEDRDTIAVTVDHFELDNLAERYSLKPAQVEQELFNAGWKRSSRITVNGSKTRIWYDSNYTLKTGKGIKASLKGSDGLVMTVESCLDAQDDSIRL